MGCRTISCIFCLFFLVFFAAPLTILTTLNYVGLEPRFYIQELYIHSSHASNNSSIFIDLKFKRVVAFVHLRYQDINITLFYGSNSNRSFSVGHGVVPGFYQGRKKTVHRNAAVEARGLPWEDAFHNISGGSTVPLTVELATKYMLKRCDGDGDCSYSNPKAMVVAADMQLDASGRKLSKKALRLH